MAITLGVDIGLFSAMMEDDSSPKKVTKLAETLNVDPALLGQYTQTQPRPDRELTKHQPAQCAT
jgi:hypothetical protein